MSIQFEDFASYRRRVGLVRYLICAHPEFWLKLSAEHREVLDLLYFAHNDVPTAGLQDYHTKLMQANPELQLAGERAFAHLADVADLPVTVDQPQAAYGLWDRQ